MKTNIFSLIALSLSTVFPSAAFADGGTFTLKGTINGFEGQHIYMAWQEADKGMTDSVKITNGSFAFSGNLSAFADSRTLFVGDMTDYRNQNRCALYVEPTAMTVVIDKDNFMKPVVTGSFTQAQADSLEAIREEIMLPAKAIQEEMRTCEDHLRHAELMEQLEPYQDKVKEAMVAWVKNHPSSYIAPLNMRFLMGDMAYQDIKTIYESFTPEVKKLDDCREIEVELKALAAIQPGQPAPLFRTKNWKGVEEGIADLRGKYVLMDFWATWCVPCRKSFPHVKALYEKYNSKGLEVFCVADDDRNEAKWKAAIEKDGIQNFHHVLRGLVWDRSKGLDGMDKTNDISEKYAVHYLPTKYLIDKDGRMIGKFNDEELDAKLKEIFGY